MHKVKEEFIPKRFHGESLRRIQQANEMIAEYMAAGYSLTLRQLYYQYVQRGIIPNTIQEYKRLGDLLSKARLAGLVDWDSFTDMTRNLKGVTGGWYEDPSDYFAGMADGYYIDLHEGQEVYLEVWVEKDALVSVVQRPCSRWRIPYFACRGYSSQSEQYAAGKRFAKKASEGKECHILHLGDHDPSGIDMTRDNDSRLSMFSDGQIEIHRIALNFDQVEELSLPPNPAKMTDSRVGQYIAAFGRHSWELDALRPEYLDNLIDENIRRFIDSDKFNKRVEEESEGRQSLETIAERYDDIMEFLRDNP